jgi:hypothetical protein
MHPDRPNERLLEALFRPDLESILFHLSMLPEAAALLVGHPVSITNATKFFRADLKLTRVAAAPMLHRPEEGGVALPPVPDPKELEPLKQYHLNLLANATPQVQTGQKIVRATGYKYSSHSRKALGLLVRHGKLERPQQNAYRLPSSPKSA